MGKLMRSYRLIIPFLALAMAFFAADAPGAVYRHQGGNPPKSADRQERLLDRLQNTLDRLRELKVKGEDVVIPLAARPLLTDLKHGLRDLIGETLNDRTAPWSTPTEVRARVLATLRGELDLIENPNQEADALYAYGEIEGIELARPEGHEELLAATTTLWVMCGNDTSFYLFRHEAEGWRLVAGQESNDYEDVLGAQGAFNYAVSPPDGSGRFFVVTTNVNPWCTSNWQGLRYRAFRPGAEPGRPDILLEGKESIFLGGDNFGTITTNPRGFGIEFEAAQSLDTGVLVRRHLLTFRLDDNGFARIPPLADSPEGFLDEWFELPWEESARWAAPSALPRLRQLHRLMGARYSGKGPHFFTEFATDPPATEAAKGRWRVGIRLTPDQDDGKLPPGLPEEILLDVVLKDGAYLLEGISGAGDSLPPEVKPDRTSGNTFQSECPLSHKGERE